MNIVRAENQIEVRHPFEQVRAFLLRHAAADADHDSLAILFVFFPPSERAVDLLFRLVAHAASVEQHEIGAVHAVGWNVALARHDLEDSFRVILIHLAAVGLDVDLFIHGTIKSTIL